jgi:hypothetical protein
LVSIQRKLWLEESAVFIDPRISKRSNGAWRN